MSTTDDREPGVVTVDEAGAEMVVMAEARGFASLPTTVRLR